jgi:hypothetical protein
MAQPNMPPPGGWRYTDPDTNVEIAGEDFNDLVYNVRRHRLSNGLIATQEIEIVITEYFCGNKIVPCVDDRGTYKAPSRILFKRTVNRVVGRSIRRRGTSAIAETMSRIPNGTAFTSRAVADIRASICASCPMNVKRRKKTCCGGDPALNALRIVIRLASHVNLLMNTHFDAALNTCNVCGCELKAKVWCSDVVINATEDPNSLALLPKDCWVKAIINGARDQGYLEGRQGVT